MLFSARNYLFCIGLALVTHTVYASHEPVSSVAIEEIKIGKGSEALPFSVVDVQYTGKLEAGTVFDSSIGRAEPFRFTLGAGQVIRGWDMGIQGMKAGGKRILTIPPELAYGNAGAGDKIPPNATLIFEVELVGVEPPPFSSIGNARLAAKLEQGITLIDIRRIDEWKETGIIDGSIKSTAFDGQGRFLKSFVETLKNTVKPEDEFALICRTGNRSAALSNWLVTRSAYKNVLNVKNGISSWIKEGNPIRKSGY